MPKVSITMATYNVAPFIRESLDSVINQTFQDTEIIIIDDCSKDGTQIILGEYQNKDKRIKLVLKDKNEGLSVSRNTALSLASGDYVTFVDGDDIIDLSLVEKAYSKIIENDSDMVLWDYAPFRETKEIEHIDTKQSALSAIYSSDKLALLRRPGFACSRMIKSDVVRRLQLHFPEGLTKQDIPIHWKLVTSLDNIVLLPERLYFYRQNIGATSMRKDKSVFSLAYVMDVVKNQLLDDGIYKQYKDEFLCQKLSRLQGMFDYIKSDYKDEAMQMIKDRLDGDAINYIRSKNRLSFRTRHFYGKIMGSHWSWLMYNSLMTTRTIYRKICH